MWRDLMESVLEDPCPPDQAREVLDYMRRRAKARFYADENFPAATVDLLRSMGAVVKTAADTQMQGFPDEAHAAYALKHGLVLVTCDRDYLDERRFPLISCPAIFVFQFGGGTEAEMRAAFQCLGTVFNTPQFYDKWSKVDASPHEWTERYRCTDGTTHRGRRRIENGRCQEWMDNQNTPEK